MSKTLTVIIVSFALAGAIAGCRASTKGPASSTPTTTPAPDAPAVRAPGGADQITPVLAHVRDLLDAGQADSAIALLGPALLRAPAPLDARLPRALVLASSEARTPWEAIRIIDELLRMRPGEAQLHVARGEIELTRGRPDVGLRSFERAILVDDRSAEAMGGFGRCRARAGGNIGSAIGYFDKLIRAKPNLASARYGKASLYLASDLVPEAVEELRWTVSMDETLWLAEADYGRSLLRQGDRGAAIPHFEKAVRLLDAAGDPLMAERLGRELQTAAEGSGQGTGQGKSDPEKKEGIEEDPGEEIKHKEEPQD